MQSKVVKKDKELSVDQKRGLMFLNCFGDVTLTWEEQDDVKMKKHIQKLIDEGHMFFIIKKKFLIFNKEVQVNCSREINDNKVLVKDDKIAGILLDVKNAKLAGKSKDDSYDVVKGSIEPSEIVKCQAVCIKPSRGG
jgi:hypothetical protein